MKEIKEIAGKKINRKKFFVYFTSFAAGAYALTKLPKDFIKTKFTEASKTSSPFTKNPLSVKRDPVKRNSGVNKA